MSSQVLKVFYPGNILLSKLLIFSLQGRAFSAPPAENSLHLFKSSCKVVLYMWYQSWVQHREQYLNYSETASLRQGEGVGTSKGHIKDRAGIFQTPSHQEVQPLSFQSNIMRNPPFVGSQSGAVPEWRTDCWRKRKGGRGWSEGACPAEEMFISRDVGGIADAMDGWESSVYEQTLTQIIQWHFPPAPQHNKCNCWFSYPSSPRLTLTAGRVLTLTLEGGSSLWKG